MLSSRLRHRVSFERQCNVQDPVTGDLLTSWAPAFASTGESLASVAAEVLTGPGREYEGSGTKNAEIAVRVNLRWFPGLNQSWRIRWQGRAFDIESIETDVTARREYRLKCVNGPNEGI